MRISAAAQQVGVPAHVLRHWEDVGVLTPDRVGANQRDYSSADVDEARIVHRLRQANLSLPLLLQLRSAAPAQRAGLLAAQVQRLRAEARNALQAAAFLEHTLECQHPIVTECPTCHGYAAPPHPADDDRLRGQGSVREALRMDAEVDFEPVIDRDVAESYLIPPLTPRTAPARSDPASRARGR
jgi:DNA-binding transcriptional MerR regulator